MRKATILVLVVGLMMTLLAGVAVAKTINGTRGDDRLAGTNASDTIRGFSGEDDDVSCGPGCERVNRVGTGDNDD